MADNQCQGRAREKSKGIAAGMCSKKQEARKHYKNMGKKQKKSKVAENPHNTG